MRTVQMFSLPPHHRNGRNHCVPALDVFVDPRDYRFAYIVMPLLRRFDDPPFELVKDVVDFVSQILTVR